MIVPIRTTEEAMAHAKDWMREAQEWEERAMQMELLYRAYKLRLLMSEKENERLRELIT